MWTVDLSGLTSDVVTAGLAILGLAVLLMGFRVVRRLVTGSRDGGAPWLSGDSHSQAEYDDYWKSYRD